MFCLVTRRFKHWFITITGPTFKQLEQAVLSTDTSFIAKGTVANRTYHSINKGSFEITCTVPLN